VRGVFYLAIHYQSTEAAGDGEVDQHSPHSRHRQQLESKPMLTSDEVSERLKRIRDEQKHPTSTHAVHNGKVGGKRQQIAGNVAVEQN
jgi:hypothetical protein